MRNRALTLMMVALLAVSLAWAGGEKGHKDSAAEAAKAEAKKKLKEEYYSRLKTILTEEQFARYQKMKAEQSGKKHN